MKLTILRLTTLSAQDRIDLAKIWPDEEIAALESSLNENVRLYAARFNARLLGALKLTLVGTQGTISQLEVREVTRRRGVGRYLMEETLAQNGSVSSWWVADEGSANQGERAAFMQACGFRAQADGWVK